MKLNVAPEPRPRSRSWLLLLIGVCAGIAVALGLVVFVGMPFALGHRNDLPLERLYGNVAVSIVARTQAGSQTNPLSQNARVLETGRNAYTGSCAECHGVSGDGKSAFGQLLYPPATDLRANDTQEKTDAQLFWIIKNGLSFTGMPAFGGQYDDQGLWALVSYTRSLGREARQAIRPVAVPTASAGQLARADPNGDAVQRGAAVYFAQACHECHGPVGNAPGDLGLRPGEREAANAIRQGRRGMPAYDQQQLTDAQLSDMLQYLNTFSGRRG
ncbi:MAG: c-type cytochrome [Chloroflexi bacterium]|nr:c-type cytochrome [Chloroflexota bacterium]MBI3733303.1 c-type cytochrome [Chloroflexota bacterium]